MVLALGIFLAAAVDGQAVLRHASALAALGPHPSGSPRAAAAAAYVAAELRDAGLPDVRVQSFDFAGKKGTNVVGALRAQGPEFVVVATHHDTPEGSPGAHESGSGPGLLIELARVLGREDHRPRTVVFVSLDGGALAGDVKTAAPGAQAYLAALGNDARNLVGVLAIGPSGGTGRPTVVHSLSYADSLRPGRYAIAPAWWARGAFSGQAADEARPRLGEASALRFLYPALVRAWRPSRPRGDDAAFVTAGHPGLWLSDARLFGSYAWAGQAADTPDKLDPIALTEAGRVARSVLGGLVDLPRGPSGEADWLVAFGRVLGPRWITLLAALSVLPVVAQGFRAGGAVLVARLVQAALSGLLIVRHPVVAMFVLLLPNVLGVLGPFWLSLAALGPALALALAGLWGLQRGVLSGTWLSLIEIAAFGLVLAASLIPSPRRPDRPVFKKIGMLKTPKGSRRRR